MIREINNNFQNIEIYTQSEIIERFNSFMTGISVCIIHENKLITIFINNLNNINEFGHFVYCSNKIVEVCPQYELSMIIYSESFLTNSLIDLTNNENIFCANDINNILHKINEILNETTLMEIC